MIEEITESLVDQIKTVAVLANSTGTTLGGGEADPTLTSIPVPAAWVVFESAQDISQGDGLSGSTGRQQRLLLTYRVVLVLAYGEGEANMKTQLRTIENVANAVRGKSSHEFAASPWAYQGCSLLAIETDRISYQLTFQTLAHFSL